MTTDNFLISLVSTESFLSNENIPQRDRRILLSFVRQIKSGQFLTQNQGLLLLKIFRENAQHIDITAATVDAPTWSQPFRELTEVKKLYIDPTNSHIVIDFTFNKRIRQIVQDLNKTISTGQVVNNNKQYLVPLTEKNIYDVMTALKRERFEVSEQLQEFFREISSIIKSESPRITFSDLNDRALKLIGEEIDTTNQLLVTDRQLRYQYTVDSTITPSTLAEKIAVRTTPKVHVNSSAYSMADVFNAVKELNRFPVLLVFGPYDEQVLVNNLKELRDSLEGFDDEYRPGIYFRCNNTPYGAEFNSLIKDLGYNKNLSASTKIAGLSTTMLPKFVFGAGWYPKTVISLTNSFKNNKTSAYTDRADLVIFYTNSVPMSANGNYYEIV